MKQVKHICIRVTKPWIHCLSTSFGLVDQPASRPRSFLSDGSNCVVFGLSWSLCILAPLGVTSRLCPRTAAYLLYAAECLQTI